MKQVTVREVYKEWESLIGEKLLLNGWIKTLRASNKFGFIELNDGSFFKGLQIVYTDILENFALINKFSMGSSIEIEGTLVKSEGSKQLFEVQAEKVELIGGVADDYPIQKKRCSLEFLRTISHLRPRTNTFAAVFRVRSILAHAIHTFFQERDFVYVHTPIITGSDCEGAGEMFKVTTLDLENIPRSDKGDIDFAKDYFGKQTSLTVSGQLAVENFCMALRDVYTFGPTFRAENSNTQRHASEFWMIEPEIAFADLEDDMNLAEDMLKFIIKYVLEKAPEEMDFFDSFIEKGLKEKLYNVINSDFERVTYTDAVEILKNSGKKFEYAPEWGNDLQTEHERYLTEVHFKKPVFVINYPKDIKAFYMRMNEDGRTVAATDLLVPGVGEIVGGSQREERPEYLEKRIAEMGLKKEDYQWYIDLRRFGTNKHAGFGLGFERAVMYITGMENIRDVIPFPRTPKNAEF